MISMSKIHSIQQLKKAGENVSTIAQKEGVSRDTVYKYIAKDDFSPKVPKIAHPKPSKLDPYKNVINLWLDEDENNWRKQRHTARQIWRRLKDEYGADISECTVSRYVAKEKKRRKSKSEQFLDLAWLPGEAQADFGEADFYYNGIRLRMKFFVLSFPHSNVGLAQVLPGENAECVCQGLKAIFEFIGFVPKRIIFDNATGVGRKLSNGVRTTELFCAFATHYGFDFSFCNPYSGNEKGNVENKVGTLRKNLFVPLPKVYKLSNFNKKLLDRCLDFSNKSHWIKGTNELALFEQDKKAMYGLPTKPFSVVRYQTATTNKQGKIVVDGNHAYSVSPDMPCQSVTVGFSAFNIDIYDEFGTHICTHKRQYGSAPTDTTDPASQLSLLIRKTNGWQNSKVRASLSDNLRAYFDSLSKKDLKEGLNLLYKESARSGWQDTKTAAERAFQSTNRLDAASIAVNVARINSGSIDYGNTIDLGTYDDLVGIARSAR